jgi:CheY-like chemotaxis protein
VADILLVDDDPAVLRVVERILKGLGHRVWKAENAGAALALLGSRGFDLAIVDLVLPRTSGIELASRVRARWPMLPVVAMSAYTSTDSTWTLLFLERLGIRGVLAKPVDRALLKAALARGLKGGDGNGATGRKDGRDG